jgi:L-asparagine transporter-like permease
MLFSLSRGNYAPQFLGRLGKAHTPIGAILVSGAGILLAAAVSMFTPLAYNYLLGVALFGAMIVWIFILVSHLSFRRRHGTTELPVRMPWFPWLQLIALGLLIAILVTMGLDREFWGISWIVGVPWLVLLSIAYFVWRQRRQTRTLPAGKAEQLRDQI